MSRYFVVPDFLLKFGDVKDVPISQGQGNNFNSILERVYLKNKEKQDNLIKSYMQKIGKLRGAYDSIFPNSETNKKMLSYLSSNFESMVDDLVKYTYDNPYDYETINGRIGELTNLLKNDTLLNKFKHDQNVLKQGRVPIVTANGDMQYLSANPQIVKGQDGNNYVIIDGKPVPEDIYRGLLKGQQYVQQQQGQPQTVSQQGTGSVAQQSGTRQGQGTTVNTTPAGTQVANYPPYNPQVYNGKNGIDGTQDINIKISLDGLNLSEAQRKLLEQQGIVSDNGVGVKDFNSNSQVLNGRTIKNLAPIQKNNLNKLIKDLDEYTVYVNTTLPSGLISLKEKKLDSSKEQYYKPILEQIANILNISYDDVLKMFTSRVVSKTIKNPIDLNEIKKEADELNLDFSEYNNEYISFINNMLKEIQEKDVNLTEEEYQNYIQNLQYKYIYNENQKQKLRNEKSINITSQLSDLNINSTGDFNIVLSKDISTLSEEDLNKGYNNVLEQIKEAIGYNSDNNKDLYKDLNFLKKLIDYSKNKTIIDGLKVDGLENAFKNSNIDVLKKYYERKKIYPYDDSYTVYNYVLNEKLLDNASEEDILELTKAMLRSINNRYQYNNRENNNKINIKNQKLESKTLNLDILHKVQTKSSTLFFNKEVKESEKQFSEIFNTIIQSGVTLVQEKGKKVNVSIKDVLEENKYEFVNSEISYYELEGIPYYNIKLTYKDENNNKQTNFYEYKIEKQANNSILNLLKYEYKKELENNNKYNNFVKRNVENLSLLNGFRYLIENKENIENIIYSPHKIIITTRLPNEKGIKTFEYSNLFVIDDRVFKIEKNVSGEPVLTLYNADFYDNEKWIKDYSLNVEAKIKERFHSKENLKNIIYKYTNNKNLNDIDFKNKYKEDIKKIYQTILEIKAEGEKNTNLKYRINQKTKDFESIAKKFSKEIDTEINNKNKDTLIHIMLEGLYLLNSLLEIKPKIHNNKLRIEERVADFTPIKVSDYLEILAYNPEALKDYPTIYSNSN